MPTSGVLKGGLDLFSLARRRVLVTGAGRGLGRGMALAAARAGAEVIGVARSVDQLSETAALVRGEGGTFTPVKADLAKIEQLEDLVEAAYTVGDVAGVVHAAGIQVRKPAAEVSVEEWRLVHAVNLEAPFFLSIAIAKRQRTAGIPGSHVFIGSLGSSIGLPGAAAYTAAKSGLLGVVRTLALEWASMGIRVNAIGPGYFHTDLTDDLLSDPAQRARVLSRIPMNRLGTADDLVGTVIYLLSDGSSYVTGQLFNVDGGWLAG